MLRRLLLIQSSIDEIAFVFNSTLGYEVSSSGDLIGSETREIQQGRAYDFDGNDDYVDIKNVLLFDNAQTIGFEGYFSTTDSSLKCIIGIRGSGNNEVKFLLSMSGGNIVLFSADDTTFISLFTSPLQYDDGVSRKVSAQIDYITKDWLVTIDDTIIGSGNDPTIRDFNVFGVTTSYIGSNDNAIGQNFLGDMHSIAVRIDGASYGTYNFDEGDGIIAYDSSGNNNHGDLINGVSHISLFDGSGADFQNQIGYTEKGLFLDGVDSLITTPIEWQGLGQLTVSFNIASVRNSFNSVVGINEDNSHSNIYVYDDGSIRFRLYTGAVEHFSRSVAGSFDIDLASWIQCVRDKDTNGGKLFIYVDGVEVTYDTVGFMTVNIVSTGGAGDNTMNIGRALTAGAARCYGILQYLSVYNVVKDSSELSNLRMAQLDTTGALGYYEMQEICNEVVLDISGQDNQGEIISGVSEIIIPKDRSNIVNDVLGQPIEHTGRVKYNADIFGYSARYFDDNDYIDTFQTFNGIVNGPDAQFTYSMWVYYPGEFVSLRALLTQYDSTSDRKSYTCSIAANSPNLQFGYQNFDINRRTFDAKGFFKIGRNHICVSYDGTDDTGDGENRMVLYRNGEVYPYVLSGAVGGFPFDTPNTLPVDRKVGSIFVASLPRFAHNDKICDVRMYSGIKNQTEVRNIYQNGVDLVNMLLWYKMDEGAGLTIFDSSGNGNHGERFNGVGFEEPELGPPYRNSLGNTPSLSGVVDNVNRRLEVPDMLQYVEGTQSFWFHSDLNLDAGPQAGVCSIYRPGNNRRSFTFSHSNGDFFFFSFYTDISNFRVYRTDIAYTDFRSCGFVYDHTQPLTSRIKIYVDGLPVAYSVVNSTGTPNAISDNGGALTVLDLMGNGGPPSTGQYNAEGAMTRAVFGQGTVTDQEMLDMHDEVSYPVNIFHLDMNEAKGTTTTSISSAVVATLNGLSRGAIPQDTSTDGGTERDARGSLLRHEGDGFSLLPGGRVNFDPGQAPELITRSVPDDYCHGDVLPGSMSKNVSGINENNFTIS